MTSDQLSEYSIENSILHYLASLGIGFFWKNVSQGFFDGGKWRKQVSPFAINGTSDILGLANGRFIAIEVKSAVGVTSKQQDAFIRKVQEFGGIAFVARSVDQVSSELRSHGLIS